MKGVYALKAANEAYEASEALAKAAKVMANLSNMSAAGAMANAEMKIAVNVGSSRSVSESSTKQISHDASRLEAGIVNVISENGNASVIGSRVSAQEGTFEGNNVNFLGETDSQSTRSDNKSTGWKVGAFVGKSGNAQGFGVEGSVNLAKGYSNADSTAQSMSHIDIDNLTVKAKNKTTVKGARVEVDHIDLDTKSLDMESVQNTDKYVSKQTSVSASGSVAYGGGGGASVSGSLNKAKTDYAQVEEQSGIFIRKSSNINVQEQTRMKSALLDSQGKKEDNHFRTGTLVMEEMENHSELKTQSISGGYSTNGNAMQMVGQAALSALGGNRHDYETSQTKSAISGNIAVEITDSQAQQKLTGKTAEQTLATLNRDTANANEKVGKQDLTKVQEAQEAAQVLGEIGAKRIGDIAQKLGLKEGSPEKMAMHGLLGYLTAKVGGGNGAAGAIAGAGSEWVNTQVAEYLKENPNLSPESRQAIQQLTAAGFGALVGQAVGNGEKSANGQRFADEQGISLREAEGNNFWAPKKCSSVQKNFVQLLHKTKKMFE